MRLNSQPSSPLSSPSPLLLRLHQGTRSNVSAKTPPHRQPHRTSDGFHLLSDGLLLSKCDYHRARALPPAADRLNSTLSRRWSMALVIVLGKGALRCSERQVLISSTSCFSGSFNQAWPQSLSSAHKFKSYLFNSKIRFLFYDFCPVFPRFLGFYGVCAPKT